MAEFLGLADFIPDTLFEILKLLYKIVKWFLLTVSDGLGKVIFVSFEYFVKLFEQLTRFVFR